MTPGRVRVEPLMGRRDRAHSKPGTFHAVAGVEAHETFRGQPERKCMVADRLRQDKDRPRARHQLGQGARVEVVGMLVAGEHDVDVVQVVAVDWRSRHAHVRPARGFVLRGQVLGKIKIDGQHALSRLDQKAALARATRRRSVPARGAVRLISSIELLAMTHRLDHGLNSLRTILAPSTIAVALAIADVAGRLREAAIGRDRNAAGVDVAQHLPESFRDKLRRLDPRVLDVDQSDGDVHGIGNRLEQLDFSHFPAGEFERELVDACPGQVRQQRGIRAMPDRAAR